MRHGLEANDPARRDLGMLSGGWQGFGRPEKALAGQKRLGLLDVLSDLGIRSLHAQDHKNTNFEAGWVLGGIRDQKFIIWWCP